MVVVVGEKAAFVFYPPHKKTLVLQLLVLDARMYFVVCFRRCGRVRKKHHCEADEDPTRQWLQRRVSAELKWAFSHHIYADVFIFIYVCIFMVLPFMSNTVDARMLYIP